MKGLKLFLGSIYVILIILLLLSLIQCDKELLNVYEPHLDTPLDDSLPMTIEDPDAVERARIIGGFGALKITLLWDFEADIDLHVYEPNGFHINFDNKKDTATGGELDQDNIPGGPGSAENIYWSNPPSGTYEVSIIYYSPKGGYTHSGECNVVIFREGRDPENRKVMMTHEGQVERISTFTI